MSIFKKLRFLEMLTCQIWGGRKTWIKRYFLNGRHLGKVMRYQLRYIRTVRDTGIEPVTSSVSGKRSPAELNAQYFLLEVETGIEPVYTVLQTVASPLGHSTLKRETRLHLRYQM